MALRRLVASDFNYILEKATNKLNVWGKQSISLARKLVLVKSVMAALPVFMAAHSLVPMSILKELDKTCRRFIWDKQGGIHGLHYVALDNLCKSWKEGGQGVNSVVNIASPLRTKFTWSLVKKEDSLLNKVLRAKYGIKIWETSTHKNSSTSLKIMSSGAQFLHKITRWKIASGKAINIMEDVWILDKRLNRWPTFIAVGNFDFPPLESFLNNGVWNKVLLLEFFGKSLVEIITQILIYPEMGEDELELMYKFSGKSITALALSSNDKEIVEVDYGRWLKKIKLNSRVECFWWRLFNNAIPTNAFLMYRRLLGHDSCHRGCEGQENSEHVMVKCVKIQQITGLLISWGFSVPNFSSSRDCKLNLECLEIENGFIAKVYC
ncbi:hypothetical protein KFK09_003951 [Dendrobium nobile]|uniref:Reverse transcriptase zinc-binding domain-containing protein n=1 Tax=Dendrobium nobile TaxID=94219 RepID=A0A8T3C1K9_DENNO|nr:hypothetical protein KFK09_003951 [Dendrobium nobile]